MHYPVFRSDSYEDELIWAAAWLYKATQDQKYLDKAEDLYSKRCNYSGLLITLSIIIPGARPGPLGPLTGLTSFLGRSFCSLS